MEEDDSHKQLAINMTAGAYTCCINWRSGYILIRTFIAQ